MPDGFSRAGDSALPGVRRQKQPAGDMSGGLSVRKVGVRGRCQAQHRRGLLHGLPGCLCHFRCGLCPGADCSPESTGCDSQLAFSINPLFCGPSSGTSRGTVFFMGRVSAILEPENGGGDDDAEYAAGPGDSGGARLTISPEPGYTVACGFDSPDSVDWGETLWVWSEKR